MMALYGGEIPNRKCGSSDDSVCISKTSVASKTSTERSTSKNTKGTSTKKTTRVRSKTAEENYFNERTHNTSKRIASTSTLLKKTNKSETYVKSKTDDGAKADKKSGQSPGHHKLSEYGVKMHNSSETITKIPGEATTFTKSRKTSEIPKLKSVECARHANSLRPLSPLSKLPIKTDLKTQRKKLKEKLTPEREIKTASKKKTVEEEKGKEALKENFEQLAPLYEKELGGLKDVWMNAVYCTFTMRSNLVKLFSDIFPYIDKTQFNMEEQTLLQLIQDANKTTTTESNNLIKTVQTLVEARDKVANDYDTIVTNKDIAHSYNYDWKDLVRKMSEVMKDIKQLQMETPDLQKKKEAFQTAGDEKIHKLEMSLSKKNEEIKKLLNQYNLLKQRENYCKGNIYLKVDDYQEIKEEVESLEAFKRELEEMKANFSYQNEVFDKKIKDLEGVLEEKEKALDREKKIKQQLQTLLGNLKDQQKRLTKMMGREPFEYVMGRTRQGRDRRRKLLWTTSVKLVLKGFYVQMKKLERDRNRMLLELQLNDSENLKALATAIVQKENFIKSLKDQIKTYYNASKLLPKKPSESACV